MTNDVRLYRRILVQTATAWPDNDDDWTTREQLSAPFDSLGWGLEMGEARLTQPFGYGLRPGQRAIGALAKVEDLPARYIRLLKRDDSGEVELTLENDDVATQWTPYWWGIVLSTGSTTDNADETPNGEASWRVAGIIYDLDIQPKRGHEVGRDIDGAAVVCDPGELLGFNIKATGDRSAFGVWDVGDTTTFIHDRTTLGNPWTALNAVEYLLAARNAEGAPAWNLSGQTDALQYSEQYELRGMTYLSRIGRIIAPRRGVGFRPVIRNHVPYLHISTAVRTAITIGSYTLPANDAPITLDIRGSQFISIERINEDHSFVLDELGIEGKRSWLARTFQYPADLDKGWTAAEEILWNAATEEERDSEPLCHVWRRFILKSTPTTLWVNNSRDLITSAGYGTDGEDGSQSADDTVGVAVHSLELTRKLPLYSGYDYTAAIESNPDLTRPLQDPRLFFLESTNWLDLSDEIGVTVDDDAAAVIIGASAAQALRVKNLVQTYDAMAVTVGVLEPLPVRVLWRRDPADWPRSTARRRIYPMHEAQLWRLAAGTILKAGSATAAAGIVRDDRPRMRQVLALARAWFENPSYEVDWIDRSGIDTANGYHEGALLTDLITGDGTKTVDNVISMREHSTPENDCHTRYSTKRVLPDLHGLL